MTLRTMLLASTLLWSIPLPARAADEVGSLIERLTGVRAEGVGNAEAAKAFRSLIRSGPESLLPLLEALDDASPPASQWLRAAIDQIAGQALTARQPLPMKELEAFTRQERHNPRGRFLAFEWLVRADPAASARLLPGMLDDSSLELRREAVMAVVANAEAKLAKNDRDGAVASFRQALTAARDRDQVQQISDQLEILGVRVDLTAHFGFIRQWQLVGPFDNAEGKNFRTVFPPEEQIDLTAAYKGKAGQTVRWQPHQTTDPYGVVDLNQAVGKDKEVIAYALAVVVTEKERDVQVRAGSNNAVQMFLNGQRIYSREFGHQGMRMDQHVGKGKLRAGRNEVVIKVCQDENVRASHQWSFQLRLCDELGGAVPFSVVSTTPAEKGKEP
jgi:hypothetical protein